MPRQDQMNLFITPQKAENKIPQQDINDLIFGIPRPWGKSVNNGKSHISN